jgi:dolichol-phosphate mannosyltransferase
MNGNPPAISVVVPVLNEVGNVESVVTEVRNALLGRMSYELVIVDDGSVDGTRELLEQMAAGEEQLEVWLHTENRGQSAAVRTGVKAARYRVIAVLDGDGQNDPRDIPRLFGQLAMVPRLSMVIGERRHRKDAWLRRLSSRVAHRIRSRLLGDGVRDTGCGIKVFYRDQYLDLPAFDHMHRFLPALMQRYGGCLCSVPVNHRPRLSGQSKYGARNRLWVGITDMLGVMWLQRRRL